MTHKGFASFEDEILNYQQRINHLFAIAIDNYQHCPTLYNAVKDTKDLIKTLVHKYDFESENIVTLYDQDATETNILKQFEEYATNLNEQDNLLIYFSGHGQEKKIFNEGYWIPVDAKMGDLGQYIPNSTIKNILSAIKTHHTFLIVDSCFSGSLFMSNTRSVVSHRLEKDASRWGLSSGRSEVVSDGKAGTNSPFAKSLIYCLENNTKALGVQELCSRVLEMTVTNAEQTPLGEPLKVEGHRNGQFVFHLKKDEQRDWEEAKESATVKAYEQYSALYPNGKFLKEAQLKIKVLKEAKAWKAAMKTNTINAYFQYQKHYPNGKYAEKATRCIAELEEEDYWNTVTKNNLISGYQRYLTKFPNGKYKSIANNKLEQLIQNTTQPIATPITNTPPKEPILSNTSRLEKTPNLSNKEDLLNNEHRVYWIIPVVLFYLFIMVVDSTWLIMAACFAPFLCAFLYPLKSHTSVHMFMGSMYGLFILAILFDILTGGSLIGLTIGEAALSILFLGGLWTGVYALNKWRYQGVANRKMKS